jgi:hypothetical protein
MKLGRGVHPTLAVALTFVLLASAAACTTAMRAHEPEACPDNEILLVRNETGRELDIYEIRGASRTMLGTVRPGSTEVLLGPSPDSRRDFMGRLDGQWISADRTALRWSYEVRCR